MKPSLELEPPARNEPLPIAIVGASYAGLTIANVLHRNAIRYVVVDAKSPPFTFVTGGAHFNVPSYRMVAEELELSKCKANEPTRKDVIESLLQRVEANLITSRRVVRVEERSGHFYLHCARSSNSKQEADTILGPFQSVVGADGVLSKVRTSALKGTFLVGDARWVNDRWHDLGTRRINRGADIALADGLELGRVIVAMRCTAGDDHTSSHERHMNTASKFCAREVSRRRTGRQITFLLGMIFATAMFKFQLRLSSLCHRKLHALKDLVFSDDCLNHDRDNPLATFRLTWLGLDETYAVLAPNPLFWVQISVLILIQSVVAAMLAVTIYKGIIQRRGFTFSYLLCWGFILPFAITFPFHLIRFFDVRNRAVLVSTAATPTLVTFRCLEALYGFSPHSVEESLQNYCLYYTSVIEFVFDKKTRLPAKASRDDVIQKGKTFLLNFIAVSLLLSFMEVHAYRPFDGDGNNAVLGRIGNNFLNSLLTSTTVATGTVAFGFAICGLAGILTLDVFDSPIFKSKSVSDFWGRRWNRLVHGVLKRGVYKPVRRHTSSGSLAALATFVASGVLHEYVLLLLSMPTAANAENGTYVDYEPLHGSQFCFFAWNGMLMLLEYVFVNWKMTPHLTFSAPPVIRSMLVILMALPVAHWFTDEYVRSGLFAHYAVGFPIIVPLE